MNAVIYARFSSAGQREESIEGQVRECTRYANAKGYTIVGTYIDRALSGTSDKRPDFQKMIRDSAKKTFQLVIAWKHDRFARNRYDAAIYKAKLKANGVKIEYAAEPSSDGAEAIILDSVLEGYAEFYSVNLSQNVKRGMYDSALKRLTLGQNCFGLMRGEDGTFVHNPLEAPIVKRIFEEYASGMPSSEIIGRLNSEGIRNRHGNLFNKNSVANIVSNPKYKGLYQYADISDPNGIPPIVSVDLWNKANARKQSNRQAPNLNDDYILTGKLFCGHCGKAMISGGGRSHTGKYYSYYRCKSNDKNPVPKDYIESIVTDKLVEIIHSDEMIETFADDFIKWQSTDSNQSEIDIIEATIKDLEKQNDNMRNAVKKGIDPEFFAESIADNKLRLGQLRIQLLELKAEHPVIERDAVIWYLERFRDGDFENVEYRKSLVRDFLQAVYLFDDGHLILQLNYSGTANTISFDLCSEVDGSILSASGSPNDDNSNLLIMYCGYMLVRTTIK